MKWHPTGKVSIWKMVLFSKLWKRVSENRDVGGGGVTNSSSVKMLSLINQRSHIGDEFHLLNHIHTQHLILPHKNSADNVLAYQKG